MIQAEPVRVTQDKFTDYLKPSDIFKRLWQYRSLLKQFIRREVMQRYKGSYLGLLWSFVTPLGLLLVYTFVFSVVFRIRWGTDLTANPAEFGLVMFTGLIVFAVFSETVMAAPHLIVSNANYVKKVVFPLEILPVSTLGAALIHSLFSLVILLAGSLIVFGPTPWTIVYLPLMYIPLILLSLGLGWFLASLGVFLRDLSHALTVIVQMLFFISPIFYPITAVPENYRFIMYINPLTFIVSHFRRVILFGQPPDWLEYIIVTVAMGGVCLFGYAWFMKSKKTFADVI